MAEVAIVPILAAAAAAFALSGVYYSLLLRPVPGEGSVPAEASAWKLGAEGLRALVTVAVVAVLVDWTDAEGWADGLVLGALLWVGFPLVLWAGAMLHEGTPWRLAALHGGDWLLKLIVVGAIVGAGT